MFRLINRFALKTKKTAAVLICVVIVLCFVVDIGKYADKTPLEVDYSRFINEELDAEEVFGNIDVSENESVLYYGVENEVEGFIYGETIQVLEGDKKSTYVTAVANPNYRFVKWSDGNTEAKRCDVISKNTVIKAEFEYLGFPDIYINVDNPLEINKNDYSVASVSVSNSEERYNFENFGVGIRIRGNSSSKFDKKSYKIKFDSKINLLGVGKAARKDWVLIANHCDQSLMRNYYAYKLAMSFGGFEVAYDCIHVNVYLNGEFNGVYLLTEQVETGASRVNVKTDGTNKDIGFLLELDSRVEDDDPNLITIGDLKFVIKSDYATREQYLYAENYLKQCNEAIISGDFEKISQLVDLDSFVDMYILQEFVKNFDVGFASLFMYIEENGGKLYFGPAWDFDLSMGNDNRVDDGGFEELFVGEWYGFGVGHEWFYVVMENEWFKSIVKDRWNELYPQIDNQIGGCVRYYLSNADELEKNFEKWDIFGERILFEPEIICFKETHKEHFDYLIFWLENRLNWLNAYFNEIEIVK